MTSSVDKLHPNRFRDLYMGVRRRINDEPGENFRMLTEDFNNRAVQINELDLLILRWEDAGGLMFDLEVGISEHLSQVDETPLNGLPDKVLYVHFGERAGLRFADGEGFVDGMYVEPVAEGVEVTFVCSEPRWKAMETDRHMIVLSGC